MNFLRKRAIASKSPPAEILWRGRMGSLPPADSFFRVVEVVIHGGTSATAFSRFLHLMHPPRHRCFGDHRAPRRHRMAHVFGEHQKRGLLPRRIEPVESAVEPAQPCLRSSAQSAALMLRKRDEALWRRPALPAAGHDRGRHSRLPGRARSKAGCGPRKLRSCRPRQADFLGHILRLGGTAEEAVAHR